MSKELNWIMSQISKVNPQLVNHSENESLEIIQKVSDQIKNQESEMNDYLLLMRTEYGQLTWELQGKKFRICHEGKPLIEHKWTKRLDLSKQLLGLRTQAAIEMRKEVNRLLEGA